MSSDQEPRYTWKLTPEEYHATEQKIAAINARAERRGFTGRLLEITGVRTTEARRLAKPGARAGDLPDHPHRHPSPAYGDWQLLAAIDTLPATDGGHEIILRCAPGIDDADVDPLPDSSPGYASTATPCAATAATPTWCATATPATSSKSAPPA